MQMQCLALELILHKDKDLLYYNIGYYKYSYVNFIISAFPLTNGIM